MGGQACVLYGAAEFSRDTDLAILASAENLGRLQLALDELHAELIAVPPFELKYLERGHAIHFAFGDRTSGKMRLDVMSRMRNVAPFDQLWWRRTELILDGMGHVDVLSLPDLINAKKTQRSKDWPMVRRLVEVSYLNSRGSPSQEQIKFWLRELRTPEMLIEAAKLFPEETQFLVAERSLLTAARAGDITLLSDQLKAEENAERMRDAEYWAPLRTELEQLRHSIRKE